MNIYCAGVGVGLLLGVGIDGISILMLIFLFGDELPIGNRPLIISHAINPIIARTMITIAIDLAELSVLSAIRKK